MGSNELQQAAVELAKLFNKVKTMAADEDFGFNFHSDGSIEFDDWMNSSCYGEDPGRTFNVEPDGSIWQASSC
ncbi:hypothetical protein AVV36_gp143 [Pectobacterium bacteriophage PM2]|uniref:Uncharacterized protein n=1 Tax=Pectobacterium bacteriophage PM2 TaxID=1429794 RepID=A0A0A0Q2F5_9CAUD|nr:hypothetical protein AVV36_gp143 [Pectobacterium bacteriophage PM2]AHY25105.1 hypothetical protein PM2_143 [Pectobacterium bacteriophage PM2]